jgi:hypothetical protein
VRSADCSAEEALSLRTARVFCVAAGRSMRAAARLAADRPFAPGLCESLTLLTLAEVPLTPHWPITAQNPVTHNDDHIAVRQHACIARLRCACAPQSCQNELGSSHDTRANASPRTDGWRLSLASPQVPGHGAPAFHPVSRRQSR